MMPPLSIPDTIAILRTRYPEALVCTACACLLATKRESYAKSDLTEEARLAYVCAECQHEQAGVERVRTVRTEVGRRNIALAHAARAAKLSSRDLGERVVE